MSFAPLLPTSNKLWPEAHDHPPHGFGNGNQTQKAQTELQEWIDVLNLAMHGGGLLRPPSLKSIQAKVQSSKAYRL